MIFSDEIMKILVKIYKSFSRTERWIFIAAGVAFVISSVFLGVDFVRRGTGLRPVAGGEYVEGIVGQPTFINPVLAEESGPNRDLTELLFSGMKDLAESYKTEDNGRTWDVRLKENLFWSDGEPITSDDVIFTVKTIQDPDSRSPLFSVWQEVQPERVSERELKFILPEPYAFFENSMRELKAIPKHIFGSIPAANFRLSDFNFEPVGSGPFKYSAFDKERSGFISEYRLDRNDYYPGGKTFIDGMTLKFYRNEDDIIKAFNSGAIDGCGGIDEKNLFQIAISHQTFELRMPRYYAVFFNPYASDALSDKSARTALNYATDKKELISKVFNNKAMVVEGPLVLGMEGYETDVYPKDNFSIDKANEILDNAGWRPNADGVREKTVDNQAKLLEFNMAVPQIPFLVGAANVIKDQWSKIGAKLNLEIYSPQDINDKIIKTRNYQMLLFGNIFENGNSPDLYSFWHSSEKFYPGMNLSLYENSSADALIMSIRKNMNASRRQSDLASLQSMIIQDQPAVFLFSPHYVYVAKNRLGGFDDEFISSASKRFQNVVKWYVKAVRIF